MEVTSDLRVHMRHVRAAKLCSGGARRYFMQHGLDWNDFLANGVPVSVLDEIGDPMGQRAVAAAKAEGAERGR